MTDLLNESMSSVLALGPMEILARVCALPIESLASAPGTAISAEVSRLSLLAEAAARRASAPDEGSAMRLDWATLSVVLYELLADADVDRPADRYLIPAHYVRSGAIARYGPEQGDPIRDPKRIIDWFVRSAEYPEPAAVPIVPSVKEAPLELVRKERNLKNRIRVLKQLGDAGVELDENCEAWVRLLPSLP